MQSRLVDKTADAHAADVTTLVAAAVDTTTLSMAAREQTTYNVNDDSEQLRRRQRNNNSSSNDDEDDDDDVPDELAMYGCSVSGGDGADHTHHLYRHVVRCYNSSSSNDTSSPTRTTARSSNNNNNNSRSHRAAVEEQQHIASAAAAPAADGRRHRGVTSPSRRQGRRREEHSRVDTRRRKTPTHKAAVSSFAPSPSPQQQRSTAATTTTSSTAARSAPTPLLMQEMDGQLLQIIRAYYEGRLRWYIDAQPPRLVLPTLQHEEEEEQQEQQEQQQAAVVVGQRQAHDVQRRHATQMTSAAADDAAAASLLLQRRRRRGRVPCDGNTDDELLLLLLQSDATTCSSSDSSSSDLSSNKTQRPRGRRTCAKHTRHEVSKDDVDRTPAHATLSQVQQQEQQQALCAPSPPPPPPSFVVLHDGDDDVLYTADDALVASSSPPPPPPQQQQQQRLAPQPRTRLPRQQQQQSQKQQVHATLSSLPSYSATSFVRAYVPDANLNLEPAVIVSGLAAALNMVVVYFLQQHVVDTHDHLGLFLIGSYLVFASYYMAYYFLDRFSGSFHRIASLDKKFYIIGNLLKAGVLVSITPFAVWHLTRIIVYDAWESNTLRNLGCIYAIPDFVSIIVVKRMRWSTWVHHWCVVVFNYFSILNDYGNENVCRCVVVYAAFSTFAYCVNVLLASRFLGVSAATARVLSVVALVVYGLCCLLNWGWQVYYIRRLLRHRPHAHWTVYAYMPLISLVVWDDVVLNRWLMHHARSTAFAATASAATRRVKQTQ